ncbi:hypothetical protein FHX36_003035 [Modestobacter versicolor]|uniref:Uncharacterized protein n=1 Tax=Modestobacter versicolor TaxID=429133 RepID=A0A839Y049_9ACTN|nr:hypothetical protein [Modestobacter versicolor]MBB3677300.1 hypothetical protein [Modestobacter versicolor]
MSSPHPPIPEPQPHTDGDDPRTQSILLPPSQRQETLDPSPAEVPAGEPPTQPAPGWTPAAAPGQPLPGQPGPGAGQHEQPTAHQPGYYDPASSTQVTGPVDFVPGFTPEAAHGSSAASPPPSPGPSTSVGMPATPPPGQRRSPLAALQGAGRHGSALLPLGLGVLALVLLQVGLALDFGNQSLWEVVPTWSAFATLGALLVLVPAVAALTGRLPARTAWRAGAVGLAALAAAWVLVALPLAASDRGFWLTAAVAAAGAALWLAPGRDE